MPLEAHTQNTGNDLDLGEVSVQIVSELIAIRFGLVRMRIVLVLHTNLVEALQHQPE